MFANVLGLLSDQGVLNDTGSVVRSPNHEVMLSPEQESLASRYLEALEKEPYSPPTDQSVEPALLAYLAERGRIVRINESLVFTTPAYLEMVSRIVDHLKTNGTITVGDVRDAFSTSRKYALPLLEYLDQQHITRRNGDQRVLLRAPDTDTSAS